MDRMSHSGRLWGSHAQGRCSIDRRCQQRSNGHRSRALCSLTRPRKCSRGAIHTVYDRRGASMARATASSTVGPAPSYGPGSSIWIVCVLWYVNRARIRPTTYLLHIVTRTSNVYESDCMQSPDEERGRQGSAILVGVVGSMPGLGQMPSAVVRGPWRVRCQGVGLSFSMSPSIGQLSDLGCMTLPRSPTSAFDEANWSAALTRVP